MELRHDVEQQRKRAFNRSLTDIRMKLALAHSIILGLALGLNGLWLDYVVIASYVIWNIFCQFIPWLKKLVVNSLSFPLLLLDLTITAYIMIRTGGLDSQIYSFWVLPVVVAAIGCGPVGVVICCTVIFLALAGAAAALGSFEWRELIIRGSYLYLIGIFAGFLIRRTHQVNEAVSQQLVQQNYDLQRLNQFLKEVSASSDLEQIFQETLKIIHEHTRTPMAAIAIFDMEGALRIADSFGWRESWLKSYQSYPLSKYSLTLAPVLVFQEPLECPDIRKHTELVQIFSETPVKSLFVYPIFIKDELIGAVLITDERLKTSSEEESRILQSITHQAGIAIQNLINLREEKQKADTDGLTGLYNRRYFHEKLEQSVSAVHQGISQRVSLILLDVDNFKGYNDKHGHPAGDRLLEKIAAVIEGEVREEDVVARYGGEEITVVLDNCANSQALQVAEAIRRSVAGIADLSEAVTVSVGVGTMPDHAADAKGLLDFTDKSLYAAKHSGKNRVCCGWFLLETGETPSK